MKNVEAKNSRLTFGDAIISVEEITPEKARVIMGDNTHNRNLRPLRVKDLAHSISAGDWQFNGDAIRIAIDGTLIDGQHRLVACIDSDKPITCVVVRGLSMETQETIDIGAKRTVADSLRLAGFPNGAQFGSALVLLDAWMKQGIIMRSSTTTMSPTKAVELARSLKNVEESFTFKSRGDLKTMMNTSTVIAMAYITSKIDDEKHNDFWMGVAYGEGLSYQDPRMALRRRLMSLDATSPYGSRSTALTQAAQAHLVISAWNSFYPNNTNRKHLILPTQLNDVENWKNINGDKLRFSTRED